MRPRGKRFQSKSQHAFSYSLNVDQYQQNYYPQEPDAFPSSSFTQARPRWSGKGPRNRAYGVHTEDYSNSSFNQRVAPYVPAPSARNYLIEAEPTFKRPRFINRNFNSNLKDARLQGPKDSDSQVTGESLQREELIQKNRTEYCCPKCNKQYSFHQNRHKFLGKFPLVLQCGDTMCQECIYRNLVSCKIKCVTCSVESVISKEQIPDYPTDMQSVFSPNYHIVGTILYNSSVDINKQNLDNICLMENTPKKLPPKSVPIDPKNVCCYTECSKEATMYCPSCENIFCEACCIVMHKYKKLMSHEPVPRKKENFSLLLEACSEHPHMSSEFFCNTCSTVACCYCALDKHVDHDRSSLYTLSEVEMAEFKQLKKVARKIFAEVLLAQKKAAQLASFDTSSVEKEIRQFFVNAYARLSLREGKLVKELANSQTNNRAINHVQASLTETAEELALLVRLDVEKLEGKKLNLKAALEKLRTVEATPRYIVNDEGLSDPIKFVANYESIDKLSSEVFLQSCKDSDYQLVSGRESSVEYVLDEPEISEIISAAKLPLRKTGTIPKKQCPKSNSSKSNGTVKKIATTSKNKPDTDQVFVQHINSMDSFYIQRKNDQTKLAQLNKNLENFVKMGGAETVQNPEISELYLVLYINESRGAKEQRWCRARLTERKADASYEAFFIDYGMTRSVTVDKIRELPDFLAKSPPFASECSLYNSMSVQWNDKAHLTLAKIINGKEVYIIEKSRENSALEVDLMILASDGGFTSVTDLLNYGYSGSTIIDRPAKDKDFNLIQEGSYRPTLTVFPNSQKFEKYQKVKVTIATVVDPHNMFVHLAQYQEEFHNLKLALRRAFKKNELSRCVPMEGTYVLVEHRDPIRSNYHRGFIKRVDLVSDKVHVLLVDWGLNVVVSPVKLRSLREEFTKMECQAILVKLAHVVPYNKQPNWLPQCLDFFKKYQECQQILHMIVHETRPNLEVALFDTTRNFDLCLNALLVEQGLADSVGNISSKVEWPQIRETVEADRDENDGGLMSALLRRAGEMENISDEEEGEQIAPNAKRRLVDVVRVESPQLLWVKFWEYRDKDAEMVRELQIHYSEKKIVKDEWEEGELCVTTLGDEYVRGKIVQINDGDFKINLYDKGRETVKTLNEIYAYETYFAKYSPAVTKAHLVGLKPAGDPKKWSISSIEALQQVVDNHRKLYAVKAVNCNDELSEISMPLYMWYGVVIPGGPLDPDRIKYVSINNLLVKLGYAHKVTPVSAADDAAASSLADGSTASKSVISDSEITEAPKEDKREGEAKKMTETDWRALMAENFKEEVQTAEALEEIVVAPANTSVEIVQSNVEEVAGWLRPYRLTKHKFKARVTCLETSGFIFLHDVSLHDVYDKLEANMKTYFDANPPKEETVDWQPGDMCTIKLDTGHWYRGTVLNVVDSNTVKVFMIDFGSDHFIDPKNLFREVLFIDIPPFATRTKLNKVYPKSGSWLTSDYDNLFALVTDWCEIEVNGPLDVDLPLVDMYNDRGEFVNHLLVQKCSNLSRSGNFYPTQQSDVGALDDIVVEYVEDGEISLKSAAPDLSIASMEKSVSDDAKMLEYKKRPLPIELLNGKRMLLELGGVLDVGTVVLRLDHIDLNDEFYQLVMDIQDAVDTLPVLTNVAVGVPCLSSYSEDDLYYRARVSDTSQVETSGKVTVYFVDYGNSEAVNLKDVKSCPASFLRLPAQAWQVALNVRLVDESADVTPFLEMLNGLVGNKILAKLVKEEPPTVDLFNKNETLCYGSLIESDVLVAVVGNDQ